MFLGNPKDSVWEDWGTLGNIREDWGESPPYLLRFGFQWVGFWGPILLLTFGVWKPRGFNLTDFCLPTLTKKS